MHKHMTFVHGMLNFVSYQFVFKCFPHLNPRSLLDGEFLQYTYRASLIMGIGGGGGENRVGSAKDVI